MSWYLQVLKKYAVFSGRARRKEFWMFVLFNVIFGIVASIIDRIIGSSIGDMGYGVIGLLYSLAVLIPGLAVTVRRLHDTGKSGGWIFICLIPIVGWIWELVLLCQDSKPEVNKYGPNPKGGAESDQQ
jgi:uncharacterized membrane protein YhaH (DUF805 family)